jgi:hydrogenase maturation protein HypF
VKEEYSFLIDDSQVPFVIDPTEIIKGIVHDLSKGTGSSIISGKFHRTIACLIGKTCETIRSRKLLNRVVLSGGVFQNMFLLSLVTERLRDSGFDVYTHHLVPTNDGGISLGQAVVAHMKLKTGILE